MLPFCVQIENGSDPPIYQLLTFDVMRKRDIAKVQVGLPPTVTVSATATATQNRVLMVVGATGAGKSTLINGIANYILGVRWDDDFRFKLITESGSHDQSKSQTSCITAYIFPMMKGSPLSYSLTVIDTPGFGDTDRLERDDKITKQIKEFFCNEEEGIDHLHAIGFVTQASLARLTPTQRYIFDAILSMFGKDIGSNIQLMTTFADGQVPPVIDAVKVAKVPFENYYKFNNSALFASRTTAWGKVDELFWDLGIGNFKDFFAKFALMEPRSLHLTKEVLKEREQLETSIKGLQHIEEIKAHHESAVTGKLEGEALIEKIKEKMSMIDEDVEAMIHQVKCSSERLQEIALKPNPLNQVDFIDLMIESEKLQKQPGWDGRIKGLQAARKKAEMMTKIVQKDVESIYPTGHPSQKGWASRAARKFNADLSWLTGSS